MNVDIYHLSVADRNNRVILLLQRLSGAIVSSNNKETDLELADFLRDVLAHNRNVDTDALKGSRLLGITLGVVLGV